MEQKELVAELEKVKAALETSLTEKNKEEIALQLKAQKDEADTLLAEAKAINTANADDLKKMNEAVEKLTADNAALIKGLGLLEIRVKSAKVIAPEAKSFNDRLEEAMVKQTDDIEKFRRKESKSLIIDLKAVGDMSIANVTGGTRYGQVMQPGIIEQPNRKVHIPELMPGGSLGPGNTYTFMRENGAGEGAIAPTAEGATKPQLDLDLIEATVNVETIAGWVRVTRKAMANIPGFISFLQSRLPEKFKKVLDAQILYGTGTTPQLKGILTAGNFVASTTVLNTFLAEKITNDIAILEDTYERDATAVLLRPIDIATFYINKASGSGEYDLPENVVFQGGQLFISGVPVYASTAITSPDYVVGDFRMGAQLLTQEGMRLEFFEQDGTNVRENKVTVRIEGNYALPVYGPDYFIKGTTARA